MKEVGLLINLYQPPTRDESQVQQFVQNCCLPLIKLLKKNKKIKIYVCIPLSTLELLDKFGHEEAILDLKNLYDTDKIELTGTTAYYSLLSNLSEKMLQKQIILNEYGLGYYLGAKQGFEGEASIVIRDLDTFLPPEFETNEKMNSAVKELGYREIFSEKKPTFYIDLSRESIELVEELIEDSVFEEEKKSITKYDKNNPIIKKIEDIEGILVKVYMTKDEDINITDFETLPIWKETDLSRIEDTSVHNKIRSFVSLSKFLCVEKYQDFGNTKTLEKYFELISEVMKYLGDEKITSEVTSRVEELRKLFV
ncbi:hypothetical protein ACFLZ4_00920 [Patescibacteria group bacterium]